MLREPMLHEQRAVLALLLCGFTIVLAWSAVHPHDYFTWVLEIFPAILALAALAITYHRFQFTSFVYLLITLHAGILFVGGHYTYAEVPLFNWIRDHFHLARNDYDRVGHFAQGFVPALVSREVLLRQKIVLKRGWLFFIVLSICLGRERSLRITGMAGCSRNRICGGRFPWHAGRPLGYAGRHGYGRDRRIDRSVVFLVLA
jgi:putative membrane protein